MFISSQFHNLIKYLNCRKEERAEARGKEKETREIQGTAAKWGSKKGS